MSWTTSSGVTVANSQQVRTLRFDESTGAISQSSYQTVVSEEKYSEGEYSNDNDDSEYEDVTITAWGDNAADTASEEQEPATWGSLLDPNFKVKAGELGSGALHRRGGNYKPVSEQYILAQRLKKGIPGAGLGGDGKKKSRGGKKKKKSVTSAVSRPPIRPNVIPRRVTVVTPSYHPPVRQPPANAPPSPWGSQPLVETPFWEKKKNPTAIAAFTASIVTSAAATAPSLAIPPSFNSSQQQPITPTPTPYNTSTTNASSITSRIINTATASSRLSTTSTTTASSTTTTTTNNIPKFNPQAEGFIPNTTTNNSSRNTPVASPATTSYYPLQKRFVTATPMFVAITPVYSTLPPKFDPGAPTFTTTSFNPNASTPTDWGGTPKFNPNVPSFTPISAAPSLSSNDSSSPNSSSTSTTTTASRHTFNTNVPEFLPFVQIPEKKIVKISAPLPGTTEKKEPAATNGLKVAPPPPTDKEIRSSMFGNSNPLLKKQLQQIHGISNNNKIIVASAATKVETTAKPTTIVAEEKELNMNTQTGPESTHGLEEPKPLIQVNMELAPGISTDILVYENSDPNELAEEFAIYHRLNITNTAKSKIALTISALLTEKKASLGLLV